MQHAPALAHSDRCSTHCHLYTRSPYVHGRSAHIHATAADSNRYTSATNTYVYASAAHIHTRATDSYSDLWTSDVGLRGDWGTLGGALPQLRELLRRVHRG